MVLNTMSAASSDGTKSEPAPVIELAPRVLKRSVWPSRPAKRVSSVRGIRSCRSLDTSSLLAARSTSERRFPPMAMARSYGMMGTALATMWRYSSISSGSGGPSVRRRRFILR